MSDRQAAVSAFYVFFLCPIAAAVGLHGWIAGLVVASAVAVGVVLIRWRAE